MSQPRGSGNGELPIHAYLAASTAESEILKLTMITNLLQGRRGRSFELDHDYVTASALRFIDTDTPTSIMRNMRNRILRREEVEVAALGSQLSMFEKPPR